MQLPVSMALKPSRTFVLLLVLVHSLALFCLATIGFSEWVALVLLPLIGVSFWRSSNGLLNARRIALLTLRDDGTLNYVRADQESGDARVRHQTMVTSWLTVILLAKQSRMEALVLLPDSMIQQHDYRRLRLWLQWKAEIS